MDSNKDDKYYAQRMIRYIDLIISYFDHLTLSGKTMKSDDQESDGIVYKFSQLREEAKNPSESFLNRHQKLKAEISLLICFRNKIIHDYESVSYSYFDAIIANDLPKLKVLLEEALAQSN